MLEPAKPTRRQMVLGAILIVALGIGLIGLAAVKGTSASAIGGPFTLTDGDGKQVTDRAFRGKYMLVYFGYTSCPDVCPTTMADMAIALNKLGAKAAQIQPLFITVDPVRDTPALLKASTAQFWPSLIGLTGTKAQITAVEKSYKVYAQEARTGSGPNDYQMDHSSIFYLMDPQGHFITVIPADEQGDALAADLARYIQ